MPPYPQSSLAAQGEPLPVSSSGSPEHVETQHLASFGSAHAGAARQCSGTEQDGLLIQPGDPQKATFCCMDAPQGTSLLQPYELYQCLPSVLA